MTVEIFTLFSISSCDLSAKRSCLCNTNSKTTQLVHRHPDPASSKSADMAELSHISLFKRKKKKCLKVNINSLSAYTELKTALEASKWSQN